MSDHLRRPRGALGCSAGEPSIGIDWNPNLATLSHEKVNTGGVAFFTANLNEYRVSFDDCPSPAKALWQDVTNATEGATTLDPIGFVDRLLTERDTCDEVARPRVSITAGRRQQYHVIFG